jgi:hypothetical protein
MNTFNLNLNLNLLKKFCKTYNTLYLDKMNIFLIQYLYNFIHLNNELQNKKIGKIIKIYVEQRIKVELKKIKTTNNVSNCLPIVLITVLESMLNTLTYTQKQKIVYKNILQHIEKQKMQSNILKFGGGYSDSLELNADENAIIIGNHTGIMEGQNWNTKSYWKNLQEKLNSDVFKIIVIDRGSASWLDSKMHSYITNFINKHIDDDGVIIFEQYLFEHIIDNFSTYNKYVIYPQTDYKNLEFGNFLWLLSKTPIYSKYVINVDSPNDLTYKNKIFASSDVRTQIASEALSLTNLYKLILNKDLSTPICHIEGLNYTGNSCYMDSVLLSTFAIPNQIISDNILNKDLDILKTYPVRWSTCDPNLDVDINKRKDIQTVIKKITMSMRGLNDVKTCSSLRKLIKTCPAGQKFHQTDTQDAGEFLTYLFNIFQVNIANTEITTYGSNELTKNPDWTLESKKVDNNASPIINVDSNTLINVENSYDITQFIKQETDAFLGSENAWKPKQGGTSYIRRKQIFTYFKSPIIIFNVFRTHGQQNFNKKGVFTGIKTKNIWKKLNAPESMLIKDKTLYLTSIVIHNGGAHYVCVFKCKRNWFYYDDNPASSSHIINYIGSYEKMLEIHPNPLSHGTLFFYT